MCDSPVQKLSAKLHGSGQITKNLLCHSEGYSVTSSTPCSKCRIAELPFFVSLSSGSQLRIHWYSSTVKQLVFHQQFEQCAQHDLSPFTFSLFYPEVSQRQHVQICLSFLGRLQSSATSCSCASLRALLELVWVSMGSKTCLKAPADRSRAELYFDQVFFLIFCPHLNPACAMFWVKRVNLNLWNDVRQIYI